MPGDDKIFPQIPSEMLVHTAWTFPRTVVSIAAASLFLRKPHSRPVGKSAVLACAQGQPGSGVILDESSYFRRWRATSKIADVIEAILPYLQHRYHETLPESG